MNDYIQQFENILKKLLLKKIQIVVNQKLFKEGQLILFQQHHFFFQLHIKNTRKNKIEIVKIPFPFEFLFKNDQLVCDYRISTFSQQNMEIEKLIRSMKFKTVSRYFDNIVFMKIL